MFPYIKHTSRIRGVISTESPEPGYIVRPMRVPTSFPASTFVPSVLTDFSLPMAYVVSIHRHLAPTVGPIAASASFTRWAGPRTYTTGCIVSGSVCMPVEPAFDEETPMMIAPCLTLLVPDLL